MTLLRRFLLWVTKSAGTLAIVLLAIGALATVLWIWSPQPATEQTGGGVWTCSMHPHVRLDKPGRCPICGMALIPVAQLETERQRVEKRAGLETEAVAYRELAKEIRTVGKLDYNERRVAFITARVDGRVDRVYADVTGTRVKANDHLVDIYSPELYSAQAELIRSLESAETTADRRFMASTLEAARTKLRLLGILPEQIEQIEQSRNVTAHLTVYAPIGGVIIEKNVREQQYVSEGDMLYRIAELDPIWLYLDVYEYDLGWIRYGQSVEVSVEAYPGEVFAGTVVFIDPFLNDQTRTVKVRVNLKNPGYRLKPAMYASAVIEVRLSRDGTPVPTGLEGKFICPMHPEIVADGPGECSVCKMPLEPVPNLFPAKPMVANATATTPEGPEGQVLAIRKSAVLDTGRRQVTYRKRSDGAFELVELKLGPLAQAQDSAGNAIDYYPVLAGLATGDEVVVRGGFLLDSERQIEGMPSLLYAEGGSVASLHAGHGGAATPAPAPATKNGDHQH
jgi:Cu(I)/Ag(I) efflux system membrane fusion protein